MQEALNREQIEKVKTYLFNVNRIQGASEKQLPNQEELSRDHLSYSIIESVGKGDPELAAEKVMDCLKDSAELIENGEMEKPIWWPN